MKIHALYQAPVRKAEPEETLADAADRMAFYEVGALVVMEGSRMVGIITERDLIRALSLGEVAGLTQIDKYMTPGPAAVCLGDDVSEAAEMMVALGTRHLPVVEGGEVVGMISARDLIAVSTLGEPAKGRAAAR
ncbi:MAG TPA: CBS domain-containing protein [Actinomycetota bacterium]